MRDQLRVQLPAEPDALSELRRLLNDLLAAADIPEAHRHEALLITDELATNAIEHGSRPGDEIEIRCSLEGKRLRVSAFDHLRKPSIPIAYTPDEERAHGRGLQLVDRLADSWTETIVGGRREVSAQLTFP